MKKNIIAKNLLEGKTCDNCFHSVLLEASKEYQINTCWLHSDDSVDPYWKKFPQEHTCDKWLTKDYPMTSVINQNRNFIKTLKGLYNLQ